ncbi:MAG: hypothetical protein Q9200_005474 [Gallowayella weberi]
MESFRHLLVTIDCLTDEISIFLWRFLFKFTKSLAYHEQILLRAGDWAARAPPNSPEQGRRRQILYKVVTRMHELSQTWINRCPYFLVLAALQNSQEFKQTGQIRKIDDAISLYERAMVKASKGPWAPPKTNIVRAFFFGNPEMLTRPYWSTDIQGFRDIDDKALKLAFIHPQDRARNLNNLGDMLADRYEYTGSSEDLSRSVTLIEEALKSTSDAVDKAAISKNLSSLLITRYENATQSIEDIERAVDLATEALETHICRASVLNTLGCALGNRYQCTGSAADLDRAIEVLDEGLQIDPKDHSLDRGRLLANLQLFLSLRFENTGSMKDLSRATEIHDEALNNPTPTGEQQSRLNTFGMSLGFQFDRTGAIESLDQSIEAYSKAMGQSSLQQPQRAFIMNNLAGGLADRFKRFGSIGDLERSVALTDQALKLLPLDSLHRRPILKNLGTRLSSLFEEKGSEEDLNRAVECASEALKLTPPNHPDRVACLSYFAGMLVRRYKRTGSIDDLDHAIKVANEALNTTHLSHADRKSQLKELKFLLSYRSRRNISIADINQYVEVNDDLIELIPTNHPDHASWLADLGEALYTRFGHTKSISDIDRAIQIIDKVIQFTPSDDPIRAFRLGELSAFLAGRHRCTRSITDIDRAIEVAQEALEATNLDSPRRLTALIVLAHTLIAKVEQTRCIDDIKPFVSIFKDGWDCPMAPPSQRILAIETVVYLLDLDTDWEGSSTLMETAVRLLPFVSPRSLKHADRQNQLKIHNGLPSRATVYALREGKRPSDALKMLDFGRGVIASFLMDLRGDVSHLEEQHPDLAVRYKSLRDDLDTPADDAVLWESSKAFFLESELKKRREADRKMNEILEEIRAQPGLSGFLLPLSEEQLRGAADLGPLIIVTVDSFSCDAFLVEKHQIRVLNLPDLELIDVENHVRDLQASHLSTSYMTSTLEWLWKSIAAPCLDALGYIGPFTDENGPRVWWIPTGPLSHLPLHAAGRHTKGSNDTVLDRVVSSYASSVKALIHGRQQASQKAQDSAPSSALLVTMKDTPDRAQLHFADEETSVLESLCGSLNLKPIRLQVQTRQEVLSQLPASAFFHFAGHGYSDATEPSRSSLLLEDWQKKPLTMADLRDLRLNQKGLFLAYLSACWTGANRAKDLDDEGINLISACQLAGFRHVIGTLWEVSDRVCVEVARMVYEMLCGDEGLTDAAVARGLHHATRALRDESMHRDSSSVPAAAESRSGSIDSRRSGAGRDGTLLNVAAKHKKELVNLFWIPYVHYGV